MAEPATDATAALPEAPPKREAWWLRRGARIIADAGKWRLLATALVIAIALIVALTSWRIPLLATAERNLYDLRMTSLAPVVDQDDRVTMVVYNDQTLIAARKRSPLDRGLLARALRNLDAMGAKSIGIDILFDQPQDEDAALIAALRAMKTPTYLGYADVAENEDQIGYEQQKFLDDFVARARTDKVKPASIRLVTDADDVARSWPERIGRLPALLVEAMNPDPAFRNYTGSIRYRMPKEADRPIFPSFQIDLFADPALAPAFAEQVRGRHILIGGDILDIDQYLTPMTGLPNTPYEGKTMIGLEVHANMLAQMLDGARLRAVPGWVIWSVAILAIAAAALTSLAELRLWQLIPYMVVQAGLFGGLPFWLQDRGWDTQGLPAVGWIMGWGIAFAAMGSAARAVGSQQRRFAQSALGKYLPRDIAAQILDEPEKLALHGEKREIFVVFTDLEGFTKLSHAIPAETVAQLLNSYLDALSDIVLAHGGTIDKFVGDAIVAFWGAPISRPDDGTNAAKAAHALWQAGEAFREDVHATLHASVPGGLPPIGKTRVGLHFGTAIVGNFGGEGRIQYTALGDSMNTASRLESANKELKSSVMASREAMERSGLDWWRPMGRVVLRGRATPVDLFEPAPDFPASDRDHLRRALATLEHDRAAGLAGLKMLVARHPEDTALAHLLYRMENSDDGEAYVLG
ncbi:adenylate/guanylate cyclase domain-containing protein [Sphingobium aquiterrae]|uniref:adenylate/guanylate cyclase domain-containing protein n=1 Tax=Sphingobium aquiterrae TaxID=2038656 RepID=UPI00301A247F